MILLWIQLGLATTGTIRGHGTTPWKVLGVGYLVAIGVGALMGVSGFAPMTSFKVGRLMGWLVIIVLAGIAISAPEDN